MKQKLLLGMISSGMLLLTGCGGEDFDSKGTGAGRIVPSVELDAQVLSAKEESRAATDITGNDLAINLTSADGSISRNWDSVADFPLDEDFKVGDYTITATYGDNSEGFELPFYQGSATVTVKENAVTPVSLTATLANAMLSIDYTDAFKSYFSAYSTDIATPGGNYIFYRADETRPAYIKPGAVGFTVNVTKPNGNEASYKPTGFTAVAQHHYHMTFDVTGEGAGTAMLVISFDDALEIEDIIIDLSEDLQNAPAPVMTVEGATPGEPVIFVEGMAPETPVQVSVVARGGLSSVVMTTKSTSLTEQGWPAEIDLIAAPENIRARLSALGLKPLGLWKNPDQLAIIDLTGVLNNIAFIEGTSNDIEFTFNVTDRYTKVAEPVTVNFHVDKLQLALSNPSKIYEGADMLDLDVEYNGLAPEKNIKFQVRNDRNTWDDVTLESIALKSRAVETYRASIKVPANDKALRVRAICGKTISEELTVERAPLPFTLSCNENDVFATHAKLSMTSSDEAANYLFPYATVYVSADGTNYTRVQTKADKNGVIELTGLKAGAVNYAKVGEKGKPFSFTTENPAVIPNGDFEELQQTLSANNMNQSGKWSISAGINYQTHLSYTISEPTGWASVNNKTASPNASNQNSWFVVPSTFNSTLAWTSTVPKIKVFGIGGGTETPSSYKNFTPQSGSNAMVIRNVAWDSNGSTPGTWLKTGIGTEEYYNHNVPNIANRSAGKLFLGSYSYSDGNENYNEGVAFTSRPTSLKGYFRYIPDSNDASETGTVTISVMNGNKVIGTGTLALSASNEYKEFNVPVTYIANAPKATSLRVMFTSSNHASYNQADETNSIKTTNYMGRYELASHGATLVVDNISLAY